MALQERLKKVTSRRQLLQGIGTGTLGLAGAALLGCGPDLKNPITSAQPSEAPLAITPLPTTINRTVISTPDTTPTKEPKKEGLVSLGDWQLEIQEWQELPYYLEFDSSRPKTPPVKQYREGWKFASIKGRVKNAGSNLSGLPKLDAIYLSSSDGNRYAMKGTSYESVRVPNSYSPDPSFPPGFSKGIEMGGWIPEIHKDYSIQTVKKGEVVREPLAPRETHISALSKPLVVPGWGNITFTNEFISKRGSFDNSTGKYQTDRYAVIEIKNTTGQDINSGQVILLISANDGKYFVAGRQVTLVPPGISKKAEFVMAGDPNALDNDFDKAIKGGLFFATYNNKQWAAWEIPSK